MQVPNRPTHAVHRINNWDGQEDDVCCLAYVGHDGELYDFDSGARLLEYEGDRIIKAIPLVWNSNRSFLVSFMDEDGRAYNKAIDTEGELPSIETLTKLEKEVAITYDSACMQVISISEIAYTTKEPE